MPSNKPSKRDQVHAEKAALVLRQFRLVFSTVRKHFQSMEKIAGLGGAQVWALSVIASQPGCGVTLLAEAMDIHQSTASNLVRSLIKSGLVQSEKSKLDKRSVELYPLPQGLKLLNKVPQPHTGILPQTLSDMDAAALEKLAHALALLLTQLQVDERSAQTPMAMI